MAAARETVMTPKGLEDLKVKIEHLRTDRRREVAERIVATPAQRADYGRLAVLAGWRTMGAGAKFCSEW